MVVEFRLRFEFLMLRFMLESESELFNVEQMLSGNGKG
jgi:hypothetical protein